MEVSWFFPLRFRPAYDSTFSISTKLSYNSVASGNKPYKLFASTRASRTFLHDSKWTMMLTLTLKRRSQLDSLWKRDWGELRNGRLKQKTKDASWACKGLRERYIDFESLRNNFSVCFVYRIWWLFQKVIYCQSPDLLKCCARQQQDLLIWLKIKLPAWRVMKHNLGLLLSFQSSETTRHNKWNIVSNRMSLSFSA